jgi:hypothetical protein
MKPPSITLTNNDTISQSLVPAPDEEKKDNQEGGGEDELAFGDRKESENSKSD